MFQGVSAALKFDIGNKTVKNKLFIYHTYILSELSVCVNILIQVLLLLWPIIWPI